VFLAAAITLFAIVVVIRAIMQPQKPKQEESPLER